MNSVMTIARITEGMRSADPRRAKGAIQAACEFIESGRSNRDDRARLARGLSAQLGSPNRKVRRWVYKLIALFRNPEYIGYLAAQLAEREQDAENRTWAYCALARLTDNHEQLLYDAGDRMTPAYSLAAGMYGRADDMPERVERAALVDDPLAHQWIGLNLGNNRAEVPPEIIRDLVRGGDPNSIEYLLWGHRLVGGSALDFPLDPLDIGKYPENVRRWYYRTVAGRPATRDVLAAEVEDWIEFDSSSLAREGLATGLTRSSRDDHWESVHRAWGETEMDPFVLQALGVDDVTPPPTPSTPEMRGITVNNYGPTITGNIGTIGAIAAHDATVTIQAPPAVDPAALAAQLLAALRAEPAVASQLLDELVDLEQASSAENTPDRATVWTRLRDVTAAIKSTTGLTKAAADAVETIDSIVRTLS